MPYAVGVSQDPDPARAIGEAVGHILDTLGPEPDVAALFATGDHANQSFPEIAHVVRKSVAPKALIGCSAQGLIAGHQEIEQGPAITLWAGRTKGNITSHYLASADLAYRGAFVDRRDAEPAAVGPAAADNAGSPDAGSADANSAGNTDANSAGDTDFTPGDAHTMVLLADPHSFNLQVAVEHFAETAPHMQIIGGFLSSPQRNIQLLSNQKNLTDGAVALLVSGDTEVVPLVSQGCKPIGHPLVITASTGNVIESLGGKPPLERLAALSTTLSEQDAELIKNGLLLGMVVNEHKTEFTRGDFLIRNIMGIDQKTGAIAIADVAPIGATVQFHLRDANTAHDDLLALLAQNEQASGALLFTCNGRGSHLFEAANLANQHPSHDAAAFADTTDNGAVGGMFCAGEIGPIGGKVAIHGFTASAALFRDA